MTNVGGYSHAPVSLRGDLRLSIISHFGLLSNFWECSVSPLQAYGPRSPRGAKPLREAEASRSATLWRKPCFRIGLWSAGLLARRRPTAPILPFERRGIRGLAAPSRGRSLALRRPMECGSLASAALWSAGLLARKRRKAPNLFAREGIRGLAAPSRGRSLALQRPMECGSLVSAALWSAEALLPLPYGARASWPASAARRQTFSHGRV